MPADNNWVPVALSASIEPSTSAGAVIDGFEVVIWRDSDGKAHLWEDRCPHRGMRMSFGFVRQNHIACLYHGWQYDVDGQCRYIPAHPDLEVPETIRIRQYGIHEHAGMIWACLADTPVPATPPELAETTTPVRSLYVDCPIAAVRDHMAAHPFTDGEGTAHAFKIEARTQNVFQLEAAGLAILIGCQSIAPTRSGLHIVALDRQEAAVAKLVAKWAESLRRVLENNVAARHVEVA